MNDLAVDIQHLRKVYKGGHEALCGISLQVPYGSIFGLIGPNGAGKSTLVKSLLTILKPTECRGTMLGEAIGKTSTLSRVGYLPEHARFPDYLTGRQVLEYAAGMCNLSRASIASKVNLLLEKVGMLDSAKNPIARYSKGMKQRIGLAQALVHDPVVVFLDEPTDGVDPEGRRDFREIIVSMREEGRTVFVNSHLLGEVEQMADSVAILNKGKILRTGSVQDLTRKDCRYEIRFVGELPEALCVWCREKDIKLHQNSLFFHAADAAQIQPLIDKLRSSLVVISSIVEERFSLEDLFIETVQEARAGAAMPPPMKKGGAA